MFLVLLPGLPAVLAVALAERAPPVVVAEEPAPMLTPGAQGSLRANSTLSGVPIPIELYELDQTYTLRIKRSDGVSAPDPLVYWSPTASGTALAADVRLLGPLTGAPSQTFTLPRPAGHIVIYSLGHGEIVAYGPVPGGLEP